MFASKKFRRVATGLFLGFGVTVLVASCGLGTTVSTSSDMLGVVYGNGSDNSDSKIHSVVYPNETYQMDSEEKIEFIPAGSRNFIIDRRDGVDRKTLAAGRTKSGVEVRVGLSSYWTVNQDKKILTDSFMPFCLKYLCAQNDPKDRMSPLGTASAGWAKMLNENFGPALDASVRKVMPQFDDSVWKTQSDWDKVSAKISETFTKELRTLTGYSDDLFCGAGDLSGWADKAKPGVGKFTCGPITVRVTLLESADASQQVAATKSSAAESLKETNAKILEAAAAKYGGAVEAGKVLGTLDMIDACKAASVNCVVAVGDSAPVVAVPQTAAK